MQVQLGSNAPPVPYEHSAVLTKPHGKVTFDRVVGGVKKFNRDALIEVGTRLLWFAFQNPHVVAPTHPNEANNRLVQGYGGAIVTLACMYGRQRGRARATEADFRLLCWELCMAEDYVLAESSAGKDIAAESMTKLAAMLQQLPENALLRRVPPNDLPFAHIVATLGRMASHQWHGRNRRRADSIRACLVYEEMLRLSTDYDSLRKAERNFLQTTYDRFTWCCSAILAFVDRPASGPNCPGVVRIHSDDVAAEPDALRAATLHDFSVAAEVLAADFEQFRAEAARMETRPAWTRSHCPELRALAKWPLVKGLHAAGVRGLVVPDPYRLVAASSDKLIFDFIDFVNQNALVDDIYGLRGGGFENYLRGMALGVRNFIDVDSLNITSGRRPDFLWLGERVGIAVEVKFGLSPNEERYHLSAPALIEAWGRAAGAVEQVRDFLATQHTQPSNSNWPTRWVMLIVTYEDLAQETTRFNVAAKRWDLLAGTGIEALHVGTATEFEHFLHHGNADSYADAILAEWHAVDPHHPSQPVLRVPHSPPPIAISSAWKRIFPDVPVPWDELARNAD